MRARGLHLFLIRHFRLPDEEPGSSGRGGPFEPPSDASILGLKIFLASLTMLFGATLVGYVLTRWRVEDWAGYDVPGLLWLSAAATLFLALVSWTLERARRRPERAARRRLLLCAALLCALGYLAVQCASWWRLAEAHGGLRGSADVSLFLFFALTGLHALHVAGGFVPLTLLVFRPTRDRTLRLAALYWHYLGAVWLVLAAALWWP